MPFDPTYYIWFLLFLLGLYVVAPRQCKNLIVAIGRDSRKKYVVVWQKAAHTDFYFKWLIVPSPNFITKVGKGRHDLHEDLAIFKYKGRDYFWCNEADVMPHKLDDGTLKTFPKELMVTALKIGQFSFNLRDRTNDEILIVADRTNAAFENDVQDMLYRKRNQIAFIAVCIIAVIAIGVIAYNIIQFQKYQDEVSPLIQAIYQKVTPNNITVNGR